MSTRRKKQHVSSARRVDERDEREHRRRGGRAWRGFGRLTVVTLGRALASFAVGMAPFATFWACSSPELLECAPGTWRRDGHIYGCVYEGDSSQMCPEEAPHRWVFGDVVLCVTELSIPASFCDGIDGCFPISGGGGGGGAALREAEACGTSAECRQLGTSSLGIPCGANDTLCPAGYTCTWTNDDYRCTPLCDPTGQDLPPCPTEAPTCTSFGRSDPSTGRAIGFCRIPNGS